MEIKYSFDETFMPLNLYITKAQEVKTLNTILIIERQKVLKIAITVLQCAMVSLSLLKHAKKRSY